MATQPNAYETLGLERTATADEIKKAYRKIALKKHPDRRPESEREAANAEFNVITSAYDLLCDESARKALDDLLEVRDKKRKRHEASDEQRKKMMADLEAREAAFERKQEDDVAKRRLHAEMERLRRAAWERQHGTAASTAPAPSTSERASDDAGAARLRRALKVTWSRKDAERYGAERLRALFTVFGGVEDVVLRDAKAGKPRASALVVMASEAQAHAAAHTALGDAD
eukprot:CAMPEP_0170135058 /NCGR_PEP_ID=MMETSP0033_2-20121228/2287_1 /TAXON_ID=195969 /ORGANISM="Dolichomastix tenuilepis, Strain CCMP3274" /LENGTH=228 /DNA_ID=CAMNT_0010370651 /DNA_START=54 /DNA_END=737 /DNA_ORIENTATION=-